MIDFNVRKIRLRRDKYSVMDWCFAFTLNAVSEREQNM